MTSDITLQGSSSRDEGGLRLQNYFHDGPFAEQIRNPTDNAVRLGSLASSEASQWCALVTLLVPYGGLLAAELRAGETLLVSGATGNFGSSAVATALAMGAGCVVAPVRNQQMLDELVRRFGPRVRPVTLSGDEAEDRKKMIGAAPGPNRLRSRSATTLGANRCGSCRSNDRSSLWTFNFYGRSRNAWRSGPRSSLPLDHEKSDNNTGPVDVLT